MKDIEKEVIKLRKQGLSRNKISEKLHIGHDRVQRILEKYQLSGKYISFRKPIPKGYYVLLEIQYDTAIPFAIGSQYIGTQLRSTPEQAIEDMEYLFSEYYASGSIKGWNVRRAFLIQCDIINGERHNCHAIYRLDEAEGYHGNIYP